MSGKPKRLILVEVLKSLIRSNLYSLIVMLHYSDLSSLKGGDLEWYFFCPKSKKYTSGSRINRTTEKGFWKATGKDRKVIHENRTVATIKTLIFHEGHAGKGKRTDWVMHEYRMEDEELAKKGIVQVLLCILFLCFYFLTLQK